MSQAAAPLVLTDEDRAELARRTKGSPPWLAERARIVLACAEPGSAVAGVAAELGSTRMTVRKWRRRFAEDGLASLTEHGRPGRPVADLALTGAERDQLTEWAQQASCAQLSVSPNTVSTHIRSIYAKLGIAHRSAAVRRARDLRLLAAVDARRS